MTIKGPVEEELPTKEMEKESFHSRILLSVMVPTSDLKKGKSSHHHCPPPIISCHFTYVAMKQMPHLPLDFHSPPTSTFAKKSEAAADCSSIAVTITCIDDIRFKDSTFIIRK